MKRLLIALIITSEAWGQVAVLPSHARYQKTAIEHPKEVLKDDVRKTINTGGNTHVLKVIEKQNAELKQMLMRKSNLPLISDNSFEFTTGTVIKAVMLNSVVSTNLESPILVAPLAGEKVGAKSRFSCTGTTKHKRVVSACNILIKDGKEYEVDAELLNPDGSSGIRGEYYEGQEGYVAGMLAAEIAKGLLSVPQARLDIKNAETSVPVAKNQLMQGLLNGANLSAETLKNQMNTTEPVVFINAGTNVLVYFKRRFKSEVSE